jgi:hypothetical protein
MAHNPRRRHEDTWLNSARICHGSAQDFLAGVSTGLARMPIRVSPTLSSSAPPVSRTSTQVFLEPSVYAHSATPTPFVARLMRDQPVRNPLRLPTRQYPKFIYFDLLRYQAPLLSPLRLPVPPSRRWRALLIVWQEAGILNMGAAAMQAGDFSRVRRLRATARERLLRCRGGSPR